MTVHYEEFKIKTKADGDMIDITEHVAEIVEKSGIKDGAAVVFCPGSTGAISTVEFEPGLKEDIPEALERIAPSHIPYKHHRTWGCDNGRSHVRATLIGPSLTVPFKNKNMILGTWQQIVFIELDTKDRSRTIVVQIWENS